MVAVSLTVLWKEDSWWPGLVAMRTSPKSNVCQYVTSIGQRKNLSPQWKSNS